jgi:hypothetical protein
MKEGGAAILYPPQREVLLPESFNILHKVPGDQNESHHSDLGIGLTLGGVPGFWGSVSGDSGVGFG